MTAIAPNKSILVDMVSGQRLPADQLKKVNQLKEFLEKILVLDPSKRLSIKEALFHPFIKDPI